MIFSKSMTVDFDTLLTVCKSSIPGGLIIGLLGYLIGKIFEEARDSDKKKGKRTHSRDLLIDDLLLNDLDKTPIKEKV